MKTNQVLEILKVLSWIFFIGFCIETGAILIATFAGIFVNPEATKNLYLGMNLSDLFKYNQWHYIMMAFLIVMVSGLKAFLFYLVIKIISKVNIRHPFNQEISKLILEISNISLQIGITAFVTRIYAKWLMKQHLHFTFDGENTEFFFLAGVLFVIAQIFKRGVELQSENELTI